MPMDHILVARELREQEDLAGRPDSQQLQKALVRFWTSLIRFGKVVPNDFMKLHAQG